MQSAARERAGGSRRRSHEDNPRLSGDASRQSSGRFLPSTMLMEEKEDMKEERQRDEADVGIVVL